MTVGFNVGLGSDNFLAQVPRRWEMSLQVALLHSQESVPAALRALLSFRACGGKTERRGSFHPGHRARASPGFVLQGVSCLTDRDFFFDGVAMG